MNPEDSQSSQEPIEVRLTALILGEATSAEEARLRSLLKTDPALNELYNDLQKTVGLVAKASRESVSVAVKNPETWRLPTEKRKALVKGFHEKSAGGKSIPFWSRDQTWWIPMTLAASLVLVVSWVAMLDGLKARTKAQRVLFESDFFPAHPASELVPPTAGAEFRAKSEKAEMASFDPAFEQNKDVAATAYTINPRPTPVSSRPEKPNLQTFNVSTEPAPTSRPLSGPDPEAAVGFSMNQPNQMIPAEPSVKTKTAAPSGMDKRAQDRMQTPASETSQLTTPGAGSSTAVRSAGTQTKLNRGQVETLAQPMQRDAGLAGRSKLPAGETPVLYFQEKGPETEFRRQLGGETQARRLSTTLPASPQAAPESREVELLKRIQGVENANGLGFQNQTSDLGVVVSMGQGGGMGGGEGIGVGGGGQAPLDDLVAMGGVDRKLNSAPNAVQPNGFGERYGRYALPAPETPRADFTDAYIRQERLGEKGVPMDGVRQREQQAGLGTAAAGLDQGSIAGGGFAFAGGGGPDAFQDADMETDFIKDRLESARGGTKELGTWGRNPDGMGIDPTTGSIVTLEKLNVQNDGISLGKNFGVLGESKEERDTPQSVFYFKSEPEIQELPQIMEGETLANAPEASRADSSNQWAMPILDIDLAVPDPLAIQVMDETRVELEDLAQVSPIDLVADKEAGAEAKRVVEPAFEPPLFEPETVTQENPVSTFSLNVSDVSWKLTSSLLENNQMPEPHGIRSEEFLNAFDYKDSMPPPGEPIAVHWESAEYPFIPSREALRISVRTGISGRVPGMNLNLVLLLDNSGSMERPDRVGMVRNALASLGDELEINDRLSMLVFSRTPQLVMDNVQSGFSEAITHALDRLVPEGGTNLEAALKAAYEIAERNYIPGGNNRIVLLTDGAANLGDVKPDSLRHYISDQREKGIALDAFGVGWDGYDDSMMENLTRNGDGRYRFLNSVETAGEEFADLLAGSLQIAAKDLKVQVEFNPDRVDGYRLVGYRKHRLTEEQFRDDTVDAAELGGEESGQALYILNVNSRGNGPLATVRVRFKDPGTLQVSEKEWVVPFNDRVPALKEATPSMKLAVGSAAFAEWLAQSPHAGEVSPTRLLNLLQGVPEAFPLDDKPGRLVESIRQAGRLAGF